MHAVCVRAGFKKCRPRRHTSLRRISYVQPAPDSKGGPNAGRKPSIAREGLSSTRRRNIGPSRDHARRGHPAEDARSRCGLREIGAAGRTTVGRGRRSVGSLVRWLSPVRQTQGVRLPASEPDLGVERCTHASGHPVLQNGPATGPAGKELRSGEKSLEIS
jgi:hypothetical protein